MIGFYAAGAMGSGGSPMPVTTWDPALKGAGITLSESDMRATKGTAGWQTAYATVGKSSGKWQFEVVFLAGTSTNRPFAAIADKTNSANVILFYAGNNAVGVQESVGYWGNGTLYWRMSTATGSTSALSTATNDIITVTIDMTLGTPEASFYRNGTLSNTRTLPTGKTWFPATSLQGGGSARLVVASLTHPVSGFSDWG